MSSFSDLPSPVPALDRPQLSLAVALHGHVTALLFWRAGCVHSRHALADLLGLAGDFEEEPFAVIGVHVPTEQAERDHDRVRRAVLGLGFEATVVLDDDRALASAMAIEALPTLALFDSAGDACFVGAGEPNLAKVRAAVEALLAVAEESGRRARVPFVAPARDAALRLHPTALVAHEGELWVGSAGHARVYRTDEEGRVERSVDGVGMPAGLCVHEGRLFVSDQRTHQVLALDLDLFEEDRGDGACGATSWTTALGNGYRSEDRFGGSFGTDQGLCSPAGLLFHEGVVYCAQAGAHQIWQFDPDTGAASSWIGSGSRQLRDGATGGAFSEPLAMAAAEDEFFVADAGNGAVRRIELSHSYLHTHARGIPRPTGIAMREDRLLVLAGWQPALLAMTKDGGEVEVLYGAEHGLVDPVAMTLVGDRLWIADAGADCLFVADLGREEPSLRRVELTGAPPVVSPERQSARGLLTDRVVLQDQCDVTLRVPLLTGPDGAGWSGADCEVDVVDESTPVLVTDCHDVVRAEIDHLVTRLPIGGCGSGTLRVCVRDAGHVQWLLVPVEVAPDGAIEAELRVAAPLSAD